MLKKLPFRAWFYFRQGWGTYFAFVLAAVNTLTVTYYLAIDKAPFLQELFPSFTIYILFTVCVGIPILIFIGYIHYKKRDVYDRIAKINLRIEIPDFESVPRVYEGISYITNIILV